MNMIRHYLKVAFCNLWKYKNQTLVSVVGLAVGFVYFDRATLMLQFQKNALLLCYYYYYFNSFIYQL
jgi:hypothetical protein